MNALHKIDDYVKTLADEVEKGELVPSDELRLAATRLNAQAEMMDLGL